MHIIRCSFRSSLLLTALLWTTLGCGKDDTTGATVSNKTKGLTILNTIEAGDTALAVSYINPNKYIQHDLDAVDGVAGYRYVLNNKPAGGFKVAIARSFQDGDYVFAHSSYDFYGKKIGFDVFRFENGLAVEHWDNLTATAAAPNPSGRTQIDGSVTVTDLDKTATNKALVQKFVDSILIAGKTNYTDYISSTSYLQHNTAAADGLSGYAAALSSLAAAGIKMEYQQSFKVLGEGNFVLAMSKGLYGSGAGEPTAFYDLFRIENGKIVEHWDVIQTIPPQSTWKNNNGKF